MTTSKKIISGAALGTLLGSLAAILYPKRHEIVENLIDRTEDISNFAEKAREYGETFLNKGKQFNFRKIDNRYSFLKGGLVGFLLGASSALLATTRSGQKLRGQFTRAYNNLSEKSEEFVHHFKNNSHHPFAMNRTMQSSIKRKKPAMKSQIRKTQPTKQANPK